MANKQRVTKKLGLFLLGCMLVGTSGVYSAAEPVGKIIFLKGKVQIKNPGASWQNATIGSVLFEKTVLQSSFRSRAVLSLNDGSRIGVKSSTIVKLQKFVKIKNGTLVLTGLKQGGVYVFLSKLNKKAARRLFRVRTPTMVAGVRGTIESVEFSPETGTVVRLIESEAEVISLFGQYMRIPQGAGGTAAINGKVEYPEVFIKRTEQVILTNPGMSGEEAGQVFSNPDLPFGSLSDIQELQDQSIQRFLIRIGGQAIAIDIEKL